MLRHKQGSRIIAWYFWPQSQKSLAKMAVHYERLEPWDIGYCNCTQPWLAGYKVSTCLTAGWSSTQLSRLYRHLINKNHNVKQEHMELGHYCYRFIPFHFRIFYLRSKSRQLLTAEVCVRPRVSPCVIYVVKSRSRTGFSPSFSVLPWQCNSTGPPYLCFIWG
jgi:hypothetical protein